MKAFVPRDKMSKRARKELDAQSRVTWAFRPVTKIVKSKKVYDRKKQPRNCDPYDPKAVFLSAPWPLREGRQAAAYRS